MIYKNLVFYRNVWSHTIIVCSFYKLYDLLQNMLLKTAYYSQFDRSTFSSILIKYLRINAKANREKRKDIILVHKYRTIV